MKIVKHGKTKENNIWIGKCTECGAEAEVYESELTNIEEDIRDGRSSWQKCPECRFGPHGGMIFKENYR